MKKSMAATLLCLSFTVFAAPHFTITSSAFKNNQFLPYRYGYCRPNIKGTVTLSNDISPQIQWKNAPAATKSFALTVIDIDGADSPHFDQKGYTLSKSLKRVPFTHWVIVNIPGHANSLPQGAGSRRFVAGGKEPGKTTYGLQGINSYTEAFSSPFRKRITFKPYTIEQTKGTYGRYDGPCAPWNDLLIHKIVFTLYALNTNQIKGLPTDGHFTSNQMQKLIKPYILAKTKITAKYATNQKLIELVGVNSGHILK